MNRISIVIIICLLAHQFSFSQTNVINSTGPVGIGTTTPVTGTYLHVYRNVTGNYNPLVMMQDALAGGFTQFGLKGTGRTFHIGVGNTGASFGLSNKFFIWDQNAVLPRFVIDANGSVGIGTTNIDNSYKLFVEGGIRSRKLKVDQTTWPDYVFHSTYQLTPLPDVEKFISQNKHLPEVPSAKEVETNGLDVGETQAVLLKKIEELTLYIIDLNKRLEEVEKENRDFKNKDQ